MQKPPSPSAGFIDFSKATSSSSSSRRPYLGRNGAPDKQSQIARWNQPFPVLVGAAVKASALSKCQWCHCWVWQPFDLLTFRHSTAVAVLPNNGCLRIEVDLLFRVSSRIWSVLFARGPEAERIIISNLTLSLLRSGRPKWPPVENYLHLSLVTWVQFSVANYLLFDKKRWTQIDLFRDISFVKKKKKHANFNVSTRISRFPAIFRLATTSKTAFVSLNFTLSTCDVLGIRHRLNSSSCTRANLVGDLRQCRDTFLTDGRAYARMCL